MDIFHIETASLGTTRTNGAIIDDVTNELPQVSFDGGPEFNLNFFDSPDDSNTGYSDDPGSVDSTIGVSISPPPQPLTTTNAIATTINCTTSSTPQTAFTTPNNFPCIGMFRFIHSVSLSLSLFVAELKFEIHSIDLTHCNLQNNCVAI